MKTREIPPWREQPPFVRLSPSLTPPASRPTGVSLGPRPTGTPEHWRSSDSNRTVVWPSNAQRALRRMEGLVFLLVLWVLAGALAKGTAWAGLSYNSSSSTGQSQSTPTPHEHSHNDFCPSRHERAVAATSRRRDEQRGGQNNAFDPSRFIHAGLALCRTPTRCAKRLGKAQITKLS